jgi:hypothetical protein
MPSSTNFRYGQVASVTLILLLTLTVGYIPASAQDSRATLQFQSSKGLKINVKKGKILVNGKVLFVRNRDSTDDDLITPSPRNQVIENEGTVFLFLEVNGSPNLDRLQVYKVTPVKVQLVADAISSDLSDLDGDGYLEFGGADLNEEHPSEDSMYYLPSHYYEIRHGKIEFDSALTREMDLRANYIYLPYPLNKDGFCCKVIVKPGMKKIIQFPLVHPDILSERIDGQANVRDTINGKVLLRLYNNVPVFTTDTVNRWYKIGLKIYIREDEYKSHILRKEKKIWTSDIEAGVTVANIPFLDEDAHKYQDGFLLDITGYTSMQNIRLETLPENILSGMISHQGQLTTAQCADLIKGFQFLKSTMGRFATFQLDEGFVDGPSAPLRLLLVFHKDTLVGVVHLRKLGSIPLKELPLDRGYNFAIIGDPNEAFINEFRLLFNAFIDRAG